MFVKVSDDLVNMDDVRNIFPDSFLEYPYCICIIWKNPTYDKSVIRFDSEVERGHCWDNIKARLGLTGSNVHLKRVSKVVRPLLKQFYPEDSGDIQHGTL